MTMLKAMKGGKYRRSRRSRQRGGNAPNPSSYSSASTYGLAVNGDGNSQYNRVFDQSGPDGSSQSNAIVGLQGQNMGTRAMWKQNGGRKRRTRRTRSRSKKGGFFGEVIRRAIVPLSILGMQQTYRRKSSNTKTKKYYRR